MKKLLLVAVLLLSVAVLANTASAQGKMSVSVGGDILLPVGDFGTLYKMGFGGSARGQYDFTPALSAGLTVGYYTWSAKDVLAGAVKPTFSGLPVRVFGKYYFMPAGKMRAYGMAELGLFFWSQKVSFLGRELSSTGSDLNACPVIGIELPAGGITVDISARYDIIFTTGSSASNIGARVGVNFPIGG